MLNSEKIAPTDKAGASIAKSGDTQETVSMVGSYTVECIAADGTVRWTDTIENLVVNVGKIDLLDKYFSGSTYTAAWYLGLVDGGSTPTYNAADTMASHAGWTENTSYSGTNRPTPTWNSATGTGGGAGSAGTGSKATTATAFSINATATIAGALLTNTAAKSPGNTGILYSAGSFTGGNRSVINGDTLNVTYTAQC
jgi:hypothetical protein